MVDAQRLPRTDGLRVVLVGHCTPDSFALRSAVRRFVPGAEVVSVSSDAGLERAVGGSASSPVLLLVNRALDGEFGAEDGIELVRGMVRPGRRVAAMLVSNLPEAQTEAVKAGAAPGFGKRELNTEAMRLALEHAAASLDRA